MSRICRFMMYEYYEAGDIVFEQGSVGTKFYVILDGKVSVQMTTLEFQTKEVAVLPKGASFGDLALIKHIPRTATI
jgi:ATP-binding cassette subfamily B protein